MIVEQRIVRLPSILETYGVSRAFIYKQMAKGLFPSQVSLGTRSVGWVKAEVDCIMLARFNGYSDDKIAKLVTRLTDERKRQLDSNLSNLLAA
ncbi:helix-turn-helix transcriptional regulator [Vibrio taketomensis]|uniref:helix-turn-helix transcriptional regulator n=1 Tax=Vibrio taketomensis TaxID=2572923 RepID=UPI00138A0E43|nr:AlpA family phage regulatory protein [Vibrio taketomensis]